MTMKLLKPLGLIMILSTLLAGAPAMGKVQCEDLNGFWHAHKGNAEVQVFIRGWLIKNVHLLYQTNDEYSYYYFTGSCREKLGDKVELHLRNGNAFLDLSTDMDPFNMDFRFVDWSSLSGYLKLSGELGR